MPDQKVAIPDEWTWAAMEAHQAQRAATPHERMEKALEAVLSKVRARMTRLSAEKVTEGEWVQPTHDGYYAVCCDCALVHRVDFKIEDDLVFLRAFREDELTEDERDARNIAVDHDAGRLP